MRRDQSASGTGAPASNGGAPASDADATVNDADAQLDHAGTAAHHAEAPASATRAPVGRGDRSATKADAPAGPIDGPASHPGAATDATGRPANVVDALASGAGAPASHAGGPPGRPAPHGCYPLAVRWLAFAVALACVAIACGSNPRNLLVIPFDAGSDATADVRGAIDAPPGDASPYLGAPCVDDAQCDDHIACTYDSCDKSAGRCLNVPDDTQCDDHIYCDGKERCVPGHGCEPGPVVSCDNGNPCQIATCVEATRSCSYKPRDVDQDGDPDSHCVPQHDCNDLNPNVSSLHAEVCANGIDDNCNGLIDEQPCVFPQGDSCANPILLSGAGTVEVSTVGANKTFATSCSVSDPQSAQDVVVAITVPPGPLVDLELWATSTGPEVSVAIDGACGQGNSELACATGAAATSVRARARSISAGTYFAVVTTQSPGTVDLKVTLLSPTPKPTNVDCASALPIQPGTPTIVQIVDPPTDLASACPSSSGELTYALTLGAAQDVRVSASTVQGSGMPVIGLRDPACAGAGDELGCRSNGTAIFERSLPAGRYVITVGASSPIDVNFEVDVEPPTPVPADQTCAAPPAVSANGRVDVDLSAHEDAIKDGCFPGGPDAAYALTLTVASDVLLVGRFPGIESSSVALDGPACDQASSIICNIGTSVPRIATRNLAAGDYRAVATDQLGLQGTLDVLVRPTIAPTIIAPGGADSCAQAQPIDGTQGGFFTGDTSAATAKFGNGCDTPGVAGAGAPDQVLSLDLAQAQRVVFDMEGSLYETILDVREGPSCPGTPIMGGCFVGSTPERSFLDVELPAGQYWIIVDGYDLNKGAWDLDVRVLPP
jgi:hypothetical protein